jgi:hypothetical protein
MANGIGMQTRFDAVEPDVAKNRNTTYDAIEDNTRIIWRIDRD